VVFFLLNFFFFRVEEGPGRVRGLSGDELSLLGGGRGSQHVRLGCKKGEGGS